MGKKPGQIVEIVEDAQRKGIVYGDESLPGGRLIIHLIDKDGKLIIDKETGKKSITIKHKDFVKVRGFIN